MKSIRLLVLIQIACAVLALLAVEANAQGSADPWIPRPVVGERATFLATASPLVPGVGDGVRTESRVVAGIGGWRRLTDFAGLGPVWMHTGNGNQVWLWLNGRARLLVDLEGPTGLDGRRRVQIGRVDVSATHYDDTDSEQLTSLGRLRTRRVHLWVHDGLDAYSRDLSFARGHGLVGWSDSLPGYEWGFYVVFVSHQRLPALPDVRLSLSLTTQDAARWGRQLLSIDGGQLTVTDLAGRDPSRTIAVDGAYDITEVRGGAVEVAAWTGGQQVVHSVDLNRDQVYTHPAPQTQNVGGHVFRLNGNAFELTDRWLSGSTRIPLPAGMPGRVALARMSQGERLLLPMAYPGSLVVIDPAAGIATDVVPTGTWPTRAEAIGDSVFVDGPARFDLSNGDLAPLLPNERVVDWTVIGDRLYALTGREALAFDAQGAVRARATLPPGMDGTAIFMTSQVVDVQDGVLLARVGEQVATVRLR